MFFYYKKVMFYVFTKFFILGPKRIIIFSTVQPKDKIFL